MDGEAESKSAWEIKLALVKYLFREGTKMVHVLNAAPQVGIYGGLEELARLMGLSNQDLAKLRDAVDFYDRTTLEIHGLAITYRGRLFSVSYWTHLLSQCPQITFVLHAPMEPEFYGIGRETGDCDAAMEQMIAALTQGLDGVTL